jgi:hypothetical protein
VPFSMAGGLILLYIREINLSVSAAVGFISLFGVAVMSGLLYIAEINGRRHTPGTPLLEAVVQGGAGPVPAASDPDRGGRAGDVTCGARVRHRIRHPAPARHGGRRGLDLDAAADPAGAPGGVRVDRENPEHSVRGLNTAATLWCSAKTSVVWEATEERTDY